MFDFLINAEVFVDDVAVAERVFVDRLGFPEQRASWSGKAPGYGFTWLFARVHPSMAMSPTRVEAMAVAPVDPVIDPALTITFLPQLLAAQGDRPWKVHANEVATSDIRRVARRLDELGCRFYTMPGVPPTPHDRLWLGWTEKEPGAYQPDVDGGLFLEICETAAIAPRQSFWDPPADTALPPGTMTRVLSRSWIVEDLRYTLSALDRSLGWRPVLGPDRDPATGCLRAVFAFAHPRSAELELLEPVVAGEVKDSLDSWGPGSWAIRIGVNDVPAKAEDLRRRGTAFTTHPDPRHGATLRVDTGDSSVPGLFEFSLTALNA
ncbi:hypothetical protein [Pseudofrankia inefficax]|uniref:VOC domain-containing protein n=1 Tax=Pseudofrankia inefficax (strain DSM 45817 / CECT 9037 / DDB 130130 / EuI1c) TaxID=298654 RepID=E3IXV9_PSEI1|nr:hypothetical protein [Pseudofrankia inefficax]ADP81414.1 hypothetical protein FraEuI1c_3405 [Pseudofrankia inefficax]